MNAVADPPKFERNWSLTILLILLVGGLYAATIAPTITWYNHGADSGELASVVATIGIAHPPGYPTYTLLGVLWSALPLGGDVAYRLNWLSALGTLIAVITLVLLTDTLTPIANRQFLPKLWGGIIFAAAPLVWSQSVITEVYAVGMGLLGILTLSYVDSLLAPTRLKAVRTGLLMGLSLGVLPQLGIVAPFILGGLVWQAQTHSDRTRRALLWGLAVFLGCSRLPTSPCARRRSRSTTGAHRPPGRISGGW